MRAKIISDFPDYVVSEDGKVIRRRDGYVLKGGIKLSGYIGVTLKKDGHQKTELLHRIVAKAFCDGYGDGKEVNHIDGDKTNNAASNLEWVSHADNLRHAYEEGLRDNDVSPRAVIATDIATGEKMTFPSIYRAARTLKISQGNICMTCQKKRPYAGGYFWQYKEA